jgi:hypothetical protein
LFLFFLLFAIDGRTGRRATPIGTYVLMSRRGRYRSSYYHRNNRTTGTGENACTESAGCEYPLLSSVTRDEFTSARIEPAASGDSVTVTVRADSVTWSDATVKNGTVVDNPELFVTFVTDTSGKNKTIGQILIPLGVLLGMCAVMGLMVRGFPCCCGARGRAPVQQHPQFAPSQSFGGTQLAPMPPPQHMQGPPGALPPPPFWAAQQPQFFQAGPPQQGFPPQHGGYPPPNPHMQGMPAQPQQFPSSMQVRPLGFNGPPQDPGSPPQKPQ